SGARRAGGGGVGRERAAARGAGGRQPLVWRQHASVLSSTRRSPVDIAHRAVDSRRPYATATWSPVVDGEPLAQEPMRWSRHHTSKSWWYVGTAGRFAVSTCRAGSCPSRRLPAPSR